MTDVQSPLKTILPQIPITVSTHRPSKNLDKLSNLGLLMLSNCSMFYLVVSLGCVQCQEEAHAVEQTVQNI